MRYMAIDLGEKRTGLAIGDRETGLITPIEVIECPSSADGGRQLLERLARAIETHLGPGGNAATIASLVVGLPVNMDGTEGPQAKKAREFGAKLGVRTGRGVVYQDERLTSADADWSMARSGMTHGQKKQKRDALAAAAILRDYFGVLGGGSPGAGSEG
ncbi:MAG: Holliday junction resolvase RuvX [Phycisphaerales bacterium]